VLEDDVPGVVDVLVELPESDEPEDSLPDEPDPLEPDPDDPDPLEPDPLEDFDDFRLSVL
jgi:hypothetical protein